MYSTQRKIKEGKKEVNLYFYYEYTSTSVGENEGLGYLTKL